jgi:hypothetical protein
LLSTQVDGRFNNVHIDFCSKAVQRYFIFFTITTFCEFIFEKIFHNSLINSVFFDFFFSSLLKNKFYFSQSCDYQGFNYFGMLGKKVLKNVFFVAYIFILFAFSMSQSWSEHFCPKIFSLSFSFLV